MTRENEGPQGPSSASVRPASVSDAPVDCTFPSEGMDCPSCAATTSRALLQVDGILRVEPDVIQQTVRVTYDSGRVEPARIRRHLARLGYGTGGNGDAARPDASAPAPVPQSGLRAFFASTPTHVWLGGGLWALTILATLVGASTATVAVLGAATVATAGWSVFPRAWAAAWAGALDMHVLMAIAALGALAIGESVEAGAVLFLFAVAREMEERTLRRARSEVRSLMDLTPVEATVLRHGHQVRVPVEGVREGEIVLVRPGERVPVDGTVTGGASEVDASAITGESVPEPKLTNDRVLGGSVNGSGALEIRCDRPAEESALSRIVRTIEDARSRRSAAEAFVDRFARAYTPLVLLGALAIAVGPPLLGYGQWADMGYRALVLVVVACPCALVISTPVTVVSALTGAVRRGILVKSGIHLEVLGKTRVVAFDKTGTVTEGTPTVSRVVSWSAEGEAELVLMAAAAESRSEHPIARAILAEAEKLGVVPDDGVEMTALPGRGARARVRGRSVLLGSPRLFHEEGLVGEEEDRAISELSKEGGSVVLVGWGAREGSPPELRGALLLSDGVREGVEPLLASLRDEGIERIVLMSGDRAPAVEAAARSASLGGQAFDEWRGDLLPEEKVAWVKELKARHGPVLMVGDGVNDAPALAVSDVGMAMARRGTALAIDTSDIALMEDDLSRIPEVFRIGRRAAGIIRTNVAFALLVKVAFVALGGAGYASLWMAVVADMGSSLAVILNGLRALRA